MNKYFFKCFKSLIFCNIDCKMNVWRSGKLFKFVLFQTQNKHFCPSKISNHQTINNFKNSVLEKWKSLNKKSKCLLQSIKMAMRKEVSTKHLSWHFYENERNYFNFVIIYCDTIFLFIYCLSYLTIYLQNTFFCVLN